MYVTEGVAQPSSQICRLSLQPKNLVRARCAVAPGVLSGCLDALLVRNELEWRRQVVAGCAGGVHSRAVADVCAGDLQRCDAMAAMAEDGDKGLHCRCLASAACSACDGNHSSQVGHKIMRVELPVICHVWGRAHAP